ncbi:MAG: hypothetical protein CME06_05575 [Gemmatimonadetes bacterium]|nr:hypothetical protein [Gemmatimonadota bacterium]
MSASTEDPFANEDAAPEDPIEQDAQEAGTPKEGELHPGLVVLQPARARRAIRLAKSLTTRIGKREELEAPLDDLDLPPLAASLQFDEDDLVVTPHVEMELNDIPIEQPTVVPLGAELRIGEVVLEYRNISDKPIVIEAEIPSDRVTSRQILAGVVAIILFGLVLTGFLRRQYEEGWIRTKPAFELQALSGLSTDGAITISPIRSGSAVVVVSGDGFAWAFDPVAGDVLWSASAGPRPVGLRSEGERVIVSFSEGAPCRIDGSSGRVIEGARSHTESPAAPQETIEVTTLADAAPALRSRPVIDPERETVVEADLDGDGEPDPITIMGDGRIRARSSATGALLIEHDCRIPVSASPLITDLDGDTRPDLCIASTNGGVYVYRVAR